MFSSSKMGTLYLGRDFFKIHGIAIDACHPESRVLVCQHRDDLSENQSANECQVRFYRRISTNVPSSTRHRPRF
jgi:hypothetical protein